MNRGTRYLVALGVAFIAYRVTVVFMELPASILIGLVAGGVTLALTAQLARPTKGARPGHQLVFGATVLLVVGLIGGLGLWAYSQSTPPRATVGHLVARFQVNGTVSIPFSLVFSNPELTSGPCRGAGYYETVQNGAAVRITGRSGQTLAAGKLGQGTIQGNGLERRCGFPFSVGNVIRGEGRYEIVIADFDPASVSEATLGQVVEVRLG